MWAACPSTIVASCESGVPVSVDCLDVQPPSYWSNPTCADQLANGKCPERIANADGYCEATCGICTPCCTKLSTSDPASATLDVSELGEGEYVALLLSNASCTVLGSNNFTYEGTPRTCEDLPDAFLSLLEPLGTTTCEDTFITWSDLCSYEVSEFYVSAPRQPLCPAFPFLAAPALSSAPSLFRRSWNPTGCGPNLTTLASSPRNNSWMCVHSETPAPCLLALQ